jgi:hypothetical protein
MRIGVPIPRVSLKLTHLDIANNKDVPIFFTKLYNTSKKENVGSEQASLLWGYLEHFSLDERKFTVQNIPSILETLVPLIRDAIVESAKVLGQILNHNDNKTTHELLFFILVYFNEMGMLKPKDVPAFAKKSGIDIAKCIDTFNPEYMDVSQIDTPIKKSVWGIIDWLKGMLRSNELFVHDVFSALLATTMKRLSFKIHEFCGPFFDNLKKSDITLEKVKDVATNLSKQEGVPEANKKRLRESLKQIESLEKDEPLGTIDIWTMAALMRQMYYNEPIDEEIANAMVFQRTGKTLDDFLTQLDNAFSLIKTEIWLAIIAYGSNSASVKKETVMSYISQYASIGMRRRWFWQSSGDDDDEKKEKEQKGKGKEEASTEDLQLQKRREARQAEEAQIAHQKHLVKLKEEYESSMQRAMKADPDSPYNADLTSEERIDQVRNRVKRRLDAARARVWDELTTLIYAREQVSNSNLLTRLNAGRAAIEQFKGSPDHRQIITETLNVLDSLLTENQEVVEERLRPLRFELDLYQAILDTLDRRVEELNGRIYRTSIRLGTVFIIVGGMIYLLYFIHQTNAAWMREVFLTVDKMKEAAEKTYTRGLVRMWENIWQESYEKARAASMLGQYTPLSWVPEFNMSPDILKGIAEESLRSLGTFITEIPSPINASQDVLLSIINKYVNFIAPYHEGLIGLKIETIVHVNKLIELGHSLDTSIELQKAQSLLTIIENALANYDAVLQLRMLKDVSYDVIMRSISLANSAFSVALEGLQEKMMMGKLPESVNIFTSVMSGLSQAPTLLWTFATTMITRAMDWARRRTPQPMDLTPSRMIDIVGAGRSPEWMANYKEVGKAAIAIGVATAAIPLMALFHVSNFVSRVYHTGWDPAQLTNAAFFQCVSGLTILWVAVFEVMERASVGNWSLTWSLGAMFLSLLSFAFPAFGIWQKLQEKIREKIGTAKPGTTEEKRIVQPTPSATPSPDEAPRQTPSLIPQPSVVNPNIFKIPEQSQIEPVTIDPQTLREASNAYLESLQNQQKKRKPRVEVVESSESEDEGEGKTDVNAYVQCHVCGNEARFMCSHCYEKSYCGIDCGRMDWSLTQNKHLSMDF